MHHGYAVWLIWQAVGVRPGGVGSFDGAIVQAVA